MASFVGKLNFSALIGVKVADIEVDGEQKKVLLIPVKDNDITLWNDEWQLWFRAIPYRNPLNRFTHFIMKFIPKSAIKRMSANQIEAFANHKIGGLIKTDYRTEEPAVEVDANTFIQNNI